MPKPVLKNVKNNPSNYIFFYTLYLKKDSFSDTYLWKLLDYLHPRNMLIKFVGYVQKHRIFHKISQINQIIRLQFKSKRWWHIFVDTNELPKKEIRDYRVIYKWHPPLNYQFLRKIANLIADENKEVYLTFWIEKEREEYFSSCYFLICYYL